MSVCWSADRFARRRASEDPLRAFKGIVRATLLSTLFTWGVIFALWLW